MPASVPELPAVEFRGVAKRYGATPAVRDLSFTVARGEFFSLLGPSGCGKTTTLRLLAGFETADAGEIRLFGEVVNQRRPYERDLAMVFQSYALFPHLSVERNVAFGLEQRKRPAAEIRDRVRAALELVRLDPGVYARASRRSCREASASGWPWPVHWCSSPRVLLLDEPLGALDLKLRKEMQVELKALNQQLGVTFIYVTHDQEEALAMSDRIAVMDQAEIAQSARRRRSTRIRERRLSRSSLAKRISSAAWRHGRHGHGWEVGSSAGGIRRAGTPGHRGRPRTPRSPSARSGSTSAGRTTYPPARTPCPARCRASPISARRFMCGWHSRTGRSWSWRSGTRGS